MKASLIHLICLVCLLAGLSACDSSPEPPAVPPPEPAPMNQTTNPSKAAADTPTGNDETVIIPQEIQPPLPVPAKPAENSTQSLKPVEPDTLSTPAKPARPSVPSFTQQTTPDRELYLRFLATGESFYSEITLENGILSYTYFANSNNRCAKWVQSSPCWRESDLKTISMALPKEDLDNLYAVANESGIFGIKADKIGGAKAGQRYYAQHVEARVDGKEKHLIYQSFPGSAQKPEAFHRIETALVEYARDLPH
ncbi:MAG: hypothetical protein JG718_07340 [Candidatus Thiothrix moscowensis]|nr:hypothetical protein [Candidatus Thiothrix moscowensis]